MLLVPPESLSFLYCARMQCYEAMGLSRHARDDYQRVLEADPNFIQKQLILKQQTQ